MQQVAERDNFKTSFFGDPEIGVIFAHRFRSIPGSDGNRRCDLRAHERNDCGLPVK